MAMRPNPNQLNNRIRQSQGMNTGATQNLDAPKGRVVVDGRELTKEEIYNNYYKVAPQARYKNQVGTLAPVDYDGQFSRDYNGHDDVAAYNNFLQASALAPRPVTEVVPYLDPLTRAEGFPEQKTYWGTIKGRTAPYPKSVLGKPDNAKYPHYVNLWAEATPTEVAHKIPGGVYELGGKTYIPGKITISRSQVHPLVTEGLPMYSPRLKTEEFLNLGQSLAGVEAIQRAGMASGNRDLTFDTKLGGTDLAQGLGWIVRPTNQNQELGEAFNPKPVQMAGFDVERSVGGVSDYRLMPAPNRRVVSDSYPAAPLWKTEPKRDIVRFPVVTREQALKDAQLADNAAWLDYKAQQEALLNQKRGSFNVVVENTGHRERVAFEGLMPPVVNQPIPGLYVGDKPWKPGVNQEGQVSSLDLPAGLNVEIPGMGRFPVTGGRTIDIDLGSKYATEKDGRMAMTEGKHLQLKNVVRDPANPFMRDAEEALVTRRQIAARATAKYQAISNSLTATDEEKTVAKAMMQQHEMEYKQGLENLQRAYSYEPQPNTQSVKYTVTVPNGAETIELMRSHGLEVFSSTNTPDRKQTVIVAQGELPIQKLHELNGTLGSRFNREEIVLPPDVSIANTANAFKDAGIAPDTLVQGVKWGHDDKGRQIIVDPGVPVGTWQGQRVTRGQVEQPTIRQITTANAPVYESDPEWRQLLDARDRAIAERLDKKVRSEARLEKKRATGFDAINTVRAQNGLPPIRLKQTNQVSYRETPSIVSSWENPQYQSSNSVPTSPIPQISDPIPPLREPEISDPIQPLSQYLTMFKPDYSNVLKRPNLNARLEKLAELEAANVANNPIVGRSVEIAYNNIPQRTAYTLRPSTPIDPSQLYTDRFAATADWVQPVADEDLMSPDLIALAKSRRQHEALPNLPSWQAMQLEAEQRHAMMLQAQKQNAATVDLNQLSQPLVSEAQVQPQEIPIDWQDSLPRPRRRVANPNPGYAEPVPQDRGWNNYITAAAALGGLGIAGGLGYAIAPKSNSQEEEELRQQLMQQQMYIQQMQQMQGRRR